MARSGSAFDVSSTAKGSLLYKFKVSRYTLKYALAEKSPIVVNSARARGILLMSTTHRLLL
jgi:hypothetical protein